LSQAKSIRALAAIDVPPHTAVSFYPEPFASRMAGRQKRQLGEFFGLRNFGVTCQREGKMAYVHKDGKPY
jgi:uncharacterized cupin superfamily protein